LFYLEEKLSVVVKLMALEYSVFWCCALKPANSRGGRQSPSRSAARLPSNGIWGWQCSCSCAQK